MEMKNIVLALALVAIVLSASTLYYTYTISNTNSDLSRRLDNMNAILQQYGEALGGGDQIAKVIGARDEGRLVVYTFQNLATVQSLLNAFMAKYPYILAEQFNGSPPAILAKDTSEIDSGLNNWDLTYLSSTQIAYLVGNTTDKIYVQPYVSPNWVALNQTIAFKDPQGYLVGVVTNPETILYNTNLVSPSEVPTSFDDLLDPKWKGKICMEDPRGPGMTRSWWYLWKNFVGETKWANWSQQFAQQNPIFHSGGELILDLLSAGEFSIAVVRSPFEAEQRKAKGAPVAWANLPTITTDVLGYALSRNAPHPNAAKLFLDYLLTPEAQTIMAAGYYLPVMKNIPLPNPLLGNLTLWWTYEAALDTSMNGTLETQYANQWFFP